MPWVFPRNDQMHGIQGKPGTEPGGGGGKVGRRVGSKGGRGDGSRVELRSSRDWYSWKKPFFLL